MRTVNSIPLHRDGRLALLRNPREGVLVMPGNSQPQAVSLAYQRGDREQARLTPATNNPISGTIRNQLQCFTSPLNLVNLLTTIPGFNGLLTFDQVTIILVT